MFSKNHKYFMLLYSYKVIVYSLNIYDIKKYEKNYNYISFISKIPVFHQLLFILKVNN